MPAIGVLQRTLIKLITMDRKNSNLGVKPFSLCSSVEWNSEFQAGMQKLLDIHKVALISDNRILGNVN